MPSKTVSAKEYSTTTIKGVEYFRTRITGVDGKRVTLYARTSEELAQKVQDAKHEIVEAKFRKENPTVAEYCQKWLLMQSAKVTPATLKGYETKIRNYIVKPLGELYMSDVTCDDIRLALVPVSKKSASVYSVVNMLIKCVFYSAERSHIIEDNPAKEISAKGGTPSKGKEALTDTQVKQLLEAVRGLPPQTFVMIGLFAGLRREEILALQWDCVFLDAPTPYISVRRAWRSERNRPVISTTLKTDTANRDIPIPKCLVDQLREVKATSISEFVIANSEGNPLSYSQFKRLWQYINVRTAMDRTYYKYINGQSIKCTVTASLGEKLKNNHNIVCTIDTHITPHQLRHTYITNLIHASVDPKTVQYLAGHKNSKVTMDIYAKVKYNRPSELSPLINEAFGQRPA